MKREKVKRFKDLVIPKVDADRVNELCSKPPEPGEVKPGSIPYKWSVTFDDGCRIEVSVHADEKDPNGSACWVDGRLVDSEGLTLREQDGCPGLPWGEWFFFVADREYTMTLTFVPDIINEIEELQSLGRQVIDLTEDMWGKLPECKRTEFHDLVEEASQKGTAIHTISMLLGKQMGKCDEDQA